MLLHTPDITMCTTTVPSGYEGSTVCEFWAGSSKGKVHDRDIEMGSAGNAGSGKELPAAGTTMSATICILTNLWHSACWR